jgi:hypothetical protein
LRPRLCGNTLPKWLLFDKEVIGEEKGTA